MEKTVENQDEKLIKAIDKGMGSQIHVRLSRFRDRDYLDIRNFYETDDGEWKPTRKGIAIPMDLYPKLMAALKEAEPLIAERSPKEKDKAE
ncbi:MAG: transcriptional coactivator p15/PC4 family protein [Candidatus Bipolaricaulota bacterium]|nr:transcriptional coactivator p15/PC4 family protein [Candidatus Bipolaricaulota bacterium]